MTNLNTTLFLLLMAMLGSVKSSAQTSQNQLHNQANLDYLTSMSSKSSLTPDELTRVRKTMLAIMNEARLNPNYRRQSRSVEPLNLPTGLKPLFLDDRLNSMAQMQANYQASTGYTGHDNSIDGDLGARARKAFGKPMIAAEAGGAPTETNLARYPIDWMAGPDHYRPTWNLDGQVVNGVGFGIAKGKGGYWYLTANWAEVEDPEANKDNLAFRKPARQSSDYQSGYGASKATDGITKGDIMNVAATKGGQLDWWEVDLGADYDIDRVVVWNRTDCCWERLQNFTLLVSTSPITGGETPGNEGKYGPLKPWTAGMTNYGVAVNRRGRYVRINAGSGDGLALAEVQVFGKAMGQNATLKYQTSMKPGDKLLEGEKLVSANGNYQLRGTTEGNFVIEEVPNGRLVYTFQLTKATNSAAMSVLNYGSDSNIVIQNKQGMVYYATTGNDANKSILNKSVRADLTDNGRFVLIDKDGQEIWATTR